MIRKFLCGLMILAPAAAAHAATDGALGATSQGTQTVVAQVGALAGQVRVTGLDDLVLSVAPGESANAVDFFCLFHSSPTFSLTVTGDVAPTAESQFSLRRPAGDLLPVDVEVVILRGAAAIGLAPLNGVAETGLLASSVTDCSDGNVASVEYSVDVGATQPDGLYSGTISFVMAVE